jgi:hypothetical protein
LAASDWDAQLMPLLRKPTTDAPVVSSDAPPKAAKANRTSMTLLVLAVAASAFAAGLSVRRSNPEPTTAAAVQTPRASEPTPAVHAARPVAAPPEFAIEPAAPEQSPASLPLAESAPKGSATRATLQSTPVPASKAVAKAEAEAPAEAPAPVTPASDAAPPDGAAAKPPVAATHAAAPAEGASAEPAFDAGAAEAAIGAAAARAASCKQPGDPKGVAVVTITFSTSGRATTANVGGEPFAGTATGGCIAAILRGARVPAFSGDFVTVKKSIRID